ncbi:MAG: carbohydrate-binding protein, partial [Bacteroidales bacterium]
ETIAWSVGLKTASDSKTGVYVSQIDNGDYLTVRSVDFGKGATRFTASAGSVSGGGSIEIRLNGVDGPLLGVCPVKATGDLTRWAEHSCKIVKTKGIHDICLLFKGEGQQLFNFDYWRFAK